MKYQLNGSSWMSKLKGFFWNTLGLTGIIIFIGFQIYLAGQWAFLDAAIYKKIFSYFEFNHKVELVSESKPSALHFCELLNQAAPEKIKNDPTLTGLYCEYIDNGHVKINQKSVVTKSEVSDEQSSNLKLIMQKNGCKFFNAPLGFKNIEDLEIKFNVYSKEDDLLFYYIANKIVCPKERSALKEKLVKKFGE